MRSPRPEADLKSMAEAFVRYGMACGADEIEVGVGDDIEFGVDVRLGEVENVVEASTRSVGLKVIRDGRTASAGSSDLSPDTIERLIRNAVRRAALASRDEHSGLPETSPSSIDPRPLDLHDPAVEEMEPGTKIDLALKTERIALSDSRIVNSHGASCNTHIGHAVLANSKGFLGEYWKTYAGLNVSLQAGSTDDLVEDFWFSSKIHLADLASPEQIARTAVERTVRHLKPRKIRTQRVPVIFDPLMSSSLLGFLCGCLTGTAVYQKATFLADRLGERIGGETLTLIDDGLLPRRLGSSPFDSEGVPSRRTVVVEHGILKTFLCNTYAGRKIGLPSTGNADGGGVGPSNFYLEPGPYSPGEIIRSTEKGLFLVRTLGQGMNPVSGDLSRGAFGIWIENGEPAYPVSEITVSGNLGEILHSIDMIGNDLEFDGSVCGPTIKVAEMQIAGH
ncbi:MAG: TldD/PmbA family protein [Candidatus Aminicenantes bacterium]|nr:TldD/PmbA family protein [Candidatus Aminicenantes bacterium]